MIDYYYTTIIIKKLILYFKFDKKKQFVKRIEKIYVTFIDFINVIQYNTEQNSSKITEI